MMILIKKTVIASLLLTSLALTACSGGNPMETQPKAEARSFLTEAAIFAEKEGHIKVFSPGNTYYSCMLDDGMVDKRSNPHVCEDLYTAMVAYARTTSGPFKHLTLEQLTDQAAFRPVYNIPLDHQSF